MARARKFGAFVYGILIEVADKDVFKTFMIGLISFLVQLLSNVNIYIFAEEFHKRYAVCPVFFFSFFL